MQIRQATEKDVPHLYELIMQLAQHHELIECVQTTPEELKNAGFSENPKFSAFVAEDEGSIAGFLSYTIVYSIWRGIDLMSIDDIFVREEFRNLKVGASLMNYAYKNCQERGIKRIKWGVLTDNHKAISFYKRLGATYSKKGTFVWQVES